MRPAAGGTRLFCAIFSAESLVTGFKILGLNHQTRFWRARRPAVRPPARSRAPISVSRIQLISGRVPTGLASPGPAQPVSRARGPGPGLVDRAAGAWLTPHAITGHRARRRMPPCVRRQNRRDGPASAPPGGVASSNPPRYPHNHTRNRRDHRSLRFRFAVGMPFRADGGSYKGPPIYLRGK